MSFDVRAIFRTTKDTPHQDTQSPPFPSAAQLSPEPFILPACYKTRRDTSHADSFHDPNADPTAYFEAHLDTYELDVYGPYLWVAGLRGYVRPLHRQRVFGRTITPIEDLSLHLVWRPGQIFVTALNAALLNHSSFQQFFCFRQGSNENDNDDDDDNKGNVKPNTTITDCIRTTSRKRVLYHNALGLLHSYTKLIIYPSDLLIAQELSLLPSTVTYAQWTRFARSIIASTASHSASLLPRWRFGELRLYRLNILVRLLPFSGVNGKAARYFVRGYHIDNENYGGFLRANFEWLLALFAAVSVILSALQVGASVDQGGESRTYTDAAWWLSNIVMGVIAGMIAMILVVLVGAFSYNALHAWASERWQRGRERQENVA